jgi:hypothetical protein
VTIAPLISSRYSAVRAIMARALSLMALGAIPSAQFMLLSADAFELAV